MEQAKNKLSLKKRSFSAMLWSGAEAFAKQGLQFGISVVLARLLGPEEYGTIALLYIFVELAWVFGDSGFSSSLVQRQDLTIVDESTVFWIHVFFGLLLTGTLCFAAPWVAEFYEKPILLPLMQIMASAFFISSLGSIHHVLLTKGLDFKRPMKVSMTAGLFSGCIAIGMALQGYGVWSLAAQTVSSSILTTTLFWMLSGWRPRFVFSLASAKRLFGYGGYLMLADLLTVSYNRIYTLYIGKVYSVADLGIYSRADNTKQIPLDVMSKMYARVAFPVFSQAASDKEKLLRGMQYALRGVMLITMPIMAGLLVSAQEVVLTLFGEKWLSVVPILEILCLAGVFWPLQLLNTNILKALGFSRLLFTTEILKKLLGIGFIVFAMPYGIFGIAWSQVAYGMMGFLINAYFSGRQLGYGIFRQIADIVPVLLVSAIMATAVYHLGQYFVLDPILMLIAKMLLGISVFLITGFLFRLRILLDIPIFFKKQPSTIS
ncbi:MAG: lipopolysaccharide biosynthesis protein [Methylomonas sp.]|nr:lipopolysaccharide biosynthesis protein [Methylomonas sp.]